MPVLPDLLWKASEALRKVGKPAEEAVHFLETVTEDPNSHRPVSDLKAAAGYEEGDAVERLLIWHAAQNAMTAVDRLEVHPSVRRLLKKELGALLSPSLAYPAGSYLFEWAARITTFRRFPTGAMDWEISGIPKSWLAKASLRELPKLAWVVGLELRGFSPCFFMHVAPKPRNRALVIEKEVLRSYYLMARSLESRPEIKGILGASWFYDPAAIRDNPHLDYLNRPIRDNGGSVFLLGPADEDAGFLEHNRERRNQFEAGELKYKIGLAIWPRRSALKWAAGRSDLDD
jgi:hypothetical protein